jgi:hypothetical protein
VRRPAFSAQGPRAYRFICRGATVVMIAASCIAGEAFAQSTGTAPLVLRLSGGARALALGNAFIGGWGSEVLFYNPGQLERGAGMTVSLQRYDGASTLGVLSSVMRLGSWTVGIGAQYLDYGATPGVFPTEPGDLTTRGSLDASSLAASLAVSRSIIGVRCGLTAKYVEERLAGERDGRPAFDVGAAKDVGDVTIALVAQNLGPDLEIGGGNVPLPRRVTAGATVNDIPVGPFIDLEVLVAVAFVRGGDVVPAAGLEFQYIPVEGWEFAGRLGVRRVKERDPAYPQPLTFGLGFSLDNVSVDYAYESFGGPGAAHVLGLRLR